MAESRSILTNWIAQHGKAYLSYSLLPVETSAILQSGFLKSQEQQLRDNQQFVFSDKSTVDISAIVKHLSSTTIRLPNRVKIVLSEEQELRRALCHGLITVDEFEVCLSEELVEAEIKKISDYVSLTKKNGKKTIITEGMPNAHSDGYGFDLGENDENYRQQELKLGQQFKMESYYLQLANDLLLQQPIDTRLAQVWAARSRVGCDNRELFLNLYKMRQAELYIDGLRPMIIARYNKVEWHDNKIIVLLASPEDLLSTYSYAINQFKDLKLNAVQFEPGSDVFLKHPIENNGQPFSIDLKKSKALLMGAMTDILPFTNAGFNTVSLENLNEQELNFLTVPARLRPATDIAVSAKHLDKLSMFFAEHSSSLLNEEKIEPAVKSRTYST
jgi:hypothetical protein